MKFRFILPLAVFAALGLAACDNKPSEGTTAPATTPEPATPAPAPATPEPAKPAPG